MAFVLIKKNQTLGSSYDMSEYLRRCGTMLLTDAMCEFLELTTAERSEKLRAGSLIEVTQAVQFGSLQDKLGQNNMRQILNAITTEDKRQHPKMSRVVNQSMFSTLPRLEDLGIVNYESFNDLFLLSFITHERMGLIKCFEKYYFSNKKTRLSKLALLPRIDALSLVQVHLESYIDRMVEAAIEEEVTRLKDGMNGGIKEAVTTLMKVPIQQLEDSFNRIMQRIMLNVVDFANRIPLLTESMVIKTVDQYKLWQFVNIKPESLVLYQALAEKLPEMPLNFTLPFISEQIVGRNSNHFELSTKTLDLGLKPQAFLHNSEFILDFFKDAFSEVWIKQDAGTSFFSTISVDLLELFPDVKYKDFFTERLDPVRDSMLYHFVGFNVSPKMQSCLAQSRKEDQHVQVRSVAAGDSRDGDIKPWTLFVKRVEDFINNELNIYDLFPPIADTVTKYTDRLLDILYSFNSSELRVVFLHSDEETTMLSPDKPLSYIQTPTQRRLHRDRLTYRDIMEFADNILAASQNGTIDHVLRALDTNDREAFLSAMRDFLTTKCSLLASLDNMSIQDRKTALERIQNTEIVSHESRGTSAQDALLAEEGEDSYGTFVTPDIGSKMSEEDKDKLDKYLDQIQRLTKIAERLMMNKAGDAVNKVHMNGEELLQVYAANHYKVGISPAVRYIQPKFLMDAYDGYYSKTFSDFDPICIRTFNDVVFTIQDGFHFRITLPFALDADTVNRLTPSTATVSVEDFSLIEQVADSTAVKYTYKISMQFLDDIKRLLHQHYELLDGKQAVASTVFKDGTTFNLDIDIGIKDGERVWAKSLMEDEDVLMTKMSDHQVALLYALNRQKLTSWHSLSDTCKTLLAHDINFQVSSLAKNSFNVLRNLDIIVDLTKSLRISDLHYLDQKYVKAAFVISLLKTVSGLLKDGIAYMPFSSDIVMMAEANKFKELHDAGRTADSEERQGVSLLEYIGLLPTADIIADRTRYAHFTLTNLIADMYEEIYKLIQPQLDLLAFAPKHLVYVKKRDFYMHAFTLLIDMFINMAVGDSLYSTTPISIQSSDQIVLQGIQKNNVRLLSVSNDLAANLIQLMTAPETDARAIRAAVNDILAQGKAVSVPTDLEARKMIDERFPGLTDIVSVLETKSTMFNRADRT